MPRWTDETRRLHALAMRAWKPWTRSTGPRTAAGKARSSRNAWKGGHRAQVLSWSRLLREVSQFGVATQNWLRGQPKPRSAPAKKESHGFGLSLDATDRWLSEMERTVDEWFGPPIPCPGGGG